MTVRRRGIVVVAALIAGFGLLHAVGARPCVSVLLHTAAGGDREAAAGAAYLLAWFGVVLVAPILTIALVLEVLCGKIARRLPAWRRSGPR
jgi:hypothetical protein